MNSLKLYLTIFQLEEYEVIRFARWVWSHPFPKELEGKKALVWTTKAKFLYSFSLVLFPVTFWIPWAALILGACMLIPYEEFDRLQLKKRVKDKILRLKKSGIKIIAISGSYGKTSSKELLFQILKTKYKVLRTPGNYNTMFGIEKVVSLELHRLYDVFICEIGTYRIGEAAEICSVILPDFVLLSGINEQHLDRFGSLENEIIGETESVEYVLKHGGKVVANFGNNLVYKKYGTDSRIMGYGQRKYNHPQEQNLEGALLLAKQLGIINPPAQLRYPPHRLSLIHRNNITIIDDAYSSNTDGFRAAVEYLKRFPGWKVIITPGISELGEQTLTIHRELGKLLKGNIDQIILVGKNDRTKGLEEGSQKKVEYITRVLDGLTQVKKTPATVLFENDLPDNYS